MANHPYATPAELRAQTDMDAGQWTDVELNIFLNAISAAIDAYCNRPDGFVADAVASARVYAGSGKAFQRIDECVEVTAVASKSAPSDSTYTAWTTADWIAFSGDVRWPEFNKKPYTQLMVTPGGSYRYFLQGSVEGAVAGAGFFPSDYWDRDIRYGLRNRPDIPGAPTVQVTAKWGYAVTVPAQIKQATLIEAARWSKRGEGVWTDAVSTGEFGEMRYTKALDPVTVMILAGGRFVKPAVGRK